MLSVAMVAKILDISLLNINAVRGPMVECID